MKVIGIVCSPRPGGNTEILVTEALAGAGEVGSETELLTLAGKTIAPCDGCNACRKTGECHIKDSMQDIYRKLEEADGFIFGSPVYFANVSAQGKTIMDRTHVFMSNRKLKGKVGGVVVAARRLGGGNVLSAVYTYMTAQRMVIAGGTIGYENESVPHGQKGAVRQDERGMKDARAVGRNVALLAKSLGK